MSMYWNFYNKNAPGAKLNLVHEGIAVISDPHIHVETVFSDNVSWSAEFGIGPRFKDIGYTHEKRWTSRELWWMTPADELISRRRAQIWTNLREMGLSEYDTRGAMGCLKTGTENPWFPFCSEGAYEIHPDHHKIICLNYRLHPQLLLELWSAMDAALMAVSKKECAM